MIRNNQNGRRRGRGGARPPQQGGGPSGNYGNNNGGGSRIDTRQRGNATQLLEKYKAMARDATQNGDRVQAEFYMQYADHYFRVLNEFRARDPQPAPRSTYDDDDDGFAPSTVGQNYAPASDRDDEDTDEGGNDRPAYRPNGERPRGNEYQGQGDRPADRPRGNDYQGQAERPRQDRDNRDNRDSGRQRGYAPRVAGDENGSDPAYRSDGRADGARRDDGRADAPRRAEGQDAARPDGDREVNRNGRYEPARGDETRRGAPRDGNGRDDSRGQLSRDGVGESAREANTPPAIEPLIGLPGPATLAPTFATGEPVAEAGEAPTPRKRGRPRKVVADSVDG